MGGIVEVEHARHQFGSLVVLDDLSLELSEGEALGVVGPNGAGKTTMLNVVAGDLRPRSGTVRLQGRDVTRMAANGRCRLGIGRTSQIPRPFLGLTVFENVLVGSTFGSTGRRGAGRGGREAVAVERLELARALATQPRVLLLDEIAGGLTESEIHELVATIKAIHAEGVSIIWIEHIVHALLSVVDRILAMDYGRKLIEGDPQVVMSSREVRDVYLGTDPEAA